MKFGLPWRVRKQMRAAKLTPPANANTPRVRIPPKGHNPHAARGIVPWETPPMFDGMTVCLIGGGPSLRGFDLSPTRAFTTVAVNNAWEIAPHAALLYFADSAWWQWNHREVLGRYPGLIATATSDIQGVPYPHPRIKRLWRDRRGDEGWDSDVRKVHGKDSGTHALNLLLHMRAAKIIMFGFDMSPAKDGATQWHKKHKRPTLVDNYENAFIPGMSRVLAECRRRGIEVIRATQPGHPDVPYREDWQSF